LVQETKDINSLYSTRNQRRGMWSEPKKVYKLDRFPEERIDLTSTHVGF